METLFFKLLCMTPVFLKMMMSRCGTDSTMTGRLAMMLTPDRGISRQIWFHPSMGLNALATLYNMNIYT